MKRQLSVGLIACAMALVIAGYGRAGTIIGVDSVSGGGNAIINPILSQQANNDNSSIPFEHNVAVISKLFNAQDPIDIVFNVETSNGATEYHIAEGVANVTGVDLLAFTFELGFGTGANFVRSAAGDGLDFDTPNLDPGPTSGRFTTRAHAPDLLRFSQGMIPNGFTDALTLSIDVPDHNSALMPASAIRPPTATSPGGYSFTLRQFPVVIPEPGTIGIAVLSALAWSVFALRRRWG